MLRQVLCFAIVGCAATASDFGAYVVFWEWGISPHLAKGISYALGVLVGFIGNKLWTFKSRRRVAPELISYGVLYTATLAINVCVNSMMLDLGGSVLGDRWKRICAFLVATCVSTLLNFLGLKLVTFREARTKRAPSPAPAGCR
jgi:putative flippase GtrA